MPLSGLRAALVAGVAVLITLGAGAASAGPSPSGTPVVPATNASGPASVAFVVPLTIRPPESGVLDATALELSTGPTGALTRQLDQIIATPAAIGLDPLLPASIRRLGDAAPESAVAWLERLRTAPNEVFLLAYADADLGALAWADALDRSVPLAIPLDPAAFSGTVGVPNAGETATPSPTAEPGQVMPGLDDLLAWTGALPGIAWPAEGTLTEDAVSALAAAGYTDLLVTSANTSGPASAMGDLGDTRAVIIDSTLSALFREASFAIGQAEYDDAFARLAAGIEAAAGATPGRSLVLALDRRWPIGVFRLAEVSAGIDALPTAQVVPLSAVLADTAAPASIIEPPPEGERSARIAAILAAAAAEEGFSTILDAPVELIGPRRLQLLSLLAVSWGSRAPEWDAAVTAFVDRSREITESVQIAESSTLVVTSGDAVVPITVSNSLDLPVTVRVDLAPERPLIRIEGPLDVTAEPGSSRTVRVPAQAITNGRVDVLVTLSSPSTGFPIGAPRVLNVELQAQWETVGLLIGAIVAVIFAAGIVRNILKRRRPARPPDPGGSDGD